MHSALEKECCSIFKNIAKDVAKLYVIYMLADKNPKIESLEAHLENIVSHTLVSCEKNYIQNVSKQ